MDASTVSAFADSVTAVAAVGAAVVAAVGLATWRDQLKGRTQYDLARRMLKNVYRLREAVRSARSPMILGGEFQAAAEEEEGEGDTEQARRSNTDEYENAIAAVYDQRWKRVAEIKSDLEADAFEAEALWGSEQSNEAFQSLRDFHGTLFAVMTEHVMRLRGDIHAPDAERGREIRRRLLGGGEEDELGDQLDEAIANVEDFLRPHLEL